MTIRSRLTLFIFIISTVCIFISAGIILINANSHLEMQSRDALRSSGVTFQILYEDFIMQNRQVVRSLSKNSDIIDSISDRHSIMAFVTERAATEEINKLEENNEQLHSVYIEKDGEYVFGSQQPEDILINSDTIIKLSENKNALIKIKIPIDNRAFVVALIDPEYLISGKLRSIRMNNNTHFFLFNTKYQSLLLHSEPEEFSTITHELKNNQFYKNENNGEIFHSYNFHGYKRIAHVAIYGDLVFGTSIPYSTFVVSKNSLVQIAMSTVIIIIIVMILVSLFASRYLTNPLRKVVLSVQDIAAHKYSSRVIVERDDELSIVGDAVNNMADQIQHHTENLEKLIHDRTKQLQQTLEEVKILSITDGLTGLFNKKHFEEVLKKEIARSARNDIEFSLIFFDLDHFKNVNDTYGHKKGDNVLIQVGRIIQKTIREIDLGARWGGEEFIIILPSTTSEGAFKLAEKLRTVMENTPYEGMESVTGSFGCTVWVKNDDEITIVQRCDKALYSSKSNGRNCTTIM